MSYSNYHLFQYLFNIYFVSIFMNTTEKQSRESPIIHELIDNNIGLHAYIVIDTLRNGNSCGGVRISDDITLEEIKALAHAMTLKYCFLKVNTGGAKAGIVLPQNCTQEKRQKILEAFGRNASLILGKKTYIPWTDLNSNVDDIATIMNAAGCEFHGIPDSSYFTALTVASAVKAAYETKDIEISTASVIIEGFGAVGMNLASELGKWGVKIVGVSTVNGALYDMHGLDINRLVELQRRYKDDLIRHYGTEPLERKELLLEMETDILIPCARPWSINSTNMKKIKAKMIVPGANIPLTSEAEEFLHQKGILCLPDFVCNIGGVCGINLFNYGNSIPRVYRFIMDEFGQLVKELILKSEKEHCLPSELAKKVAEKNCNVINLKYKSSNHVSQIFPKLLFEIFPSLRGWNLIQNQRKLFNENIRLIKEQC
jgi:glutamate dehydrogenase (NAD(P)+)